MSRSDLLIRQITEKYPTIAAWTINVTVSEQWVRSTISLAYMKRLHLISERSSGRELLCGTFLSVQESSVLKQIILKNVGQICPIYWLYVINQFGFNNNKIYLINVFLNFFINGWFAKSFPDSIIASLVSLSICFAVFRYVFSALVAGIFFTLYTGCPCEET